MMRNVYKTPSGKKRELPSDSDKRTYISIKDRVPESWIDLINENRRDKKIHLWEIRRITKLKETVLSHIVNKEQYCSYAQYWQIVQAIAEILAEREGILA